MREMFLDMLYRKEREKIRDYLNGELALDELLSEFDIEECSICGTYGLTEDLSINKICEQCKGDM